ncbi:hypothetical protein LXA43DRAFT_1066986 [Ganoderma leucocontextum]|nr:hypothetical protein LXA43DRAFT_1066986 [Ganoderma leucocontextum]
MSTPTQHAPSSAESSSPWLPPELVSRILTKLWEAPQTPQERSALLKNITLVNRAWLTLVALITSRDVHISSKRNAHNFLRLLSKTSPIPKADDLFTTERTRFANDACRSITFHVVDGTFSEWPSPLTKEIVAALIMPDPWPSPADDADDAISLVLDKISAPDWHLPNLQHISLRYTDRAFADVFRHLELGPFPPQVTRLSIDYSFSIWHLKFIFSQLWMESSDRDDTRGYVPLPGAGETPRRVVSMIPNLRYLALTSGATTAFVTAILPLCPNVETLEITQPSAVRLEAIGPQVPSALRTLVLRHPGALSWEQLCRWELCLALDSGLFKFPARHGGTSTTTKPRIVVRSGTLDDPVVFMEVRRRCECFDVELVHERDDAWSL